ncbi:MAG: NAD(P)-dependent oxidoreductase, partial [Phycisphaerales bacterium]
IAVCNTPGMNAAAVAELVFGLLLAMDRHIASGTADLRAGRWNKKDYSKARGVKGLTLGIIGVGGIGREVIKRAHAFGMKCIAHSLNMTRDRAADLGVEFGGSTRADLLSMAGRCDVISVMVAANKESEKMCDAGFFGAMRSGAYFINTSRGSVVDEPALIEAVRSKGLRVGADVFAGEPSGGQAEWKSALADLPGFVGTHHVGASTDQAQSAVADEVVRIVKVFQDSGRWENKVN